MKRCPLCAIEVGELAERCPECHGRLLVAVPAKSERNLRPSPWLVLTVVGALVLAWALWQAAVRA